VDGNVSAARSRDPKLARDSGRSRSLISVLIVNYNYGRYIEEAVQSVLEQDYQPFEVVICDDGSTDDSLQVISTLAGAYPKQIRFVAKENGGVASALNTAYREASGEIISLLDADDRFARNKLSLIAKAFADDPDTGIVVNRMIKFGEGTEMSGLIPQFGELDSGWIRDKMLRSGGHWSFAPASGISLRRACAEEIFPIPEDAFRSEADAYIFTQAPLSWAVGAIGEPISHYRLHSNNLTSTAHLDASYADRIVSGLERMNSALIDAAKARGLPLPHLRDNPTYAEMLFLHDYSEGAPPGLLAARLRQLWRAAFRCETADRIRWRIKPFLLTFAALLPKALGIRFLEAMYLPSGWRRTLAANLLRVRARDSSQRHRWRSQ